VGTELLGERIKGRGGGAGGIAWEVLFSVITQVTQAYPINKFLAETEVPAVAKLWKKAVKIL
jgi:hypothetical protein